MKKILKRKEQDNVKLLKAMVKENYYYAYCQNKQSEY
jgi:hypothetical protein